MFIHLFPSSKEPGNLLLVLILKELAAGHCPKPLEFSYSLTPSFLNIHFIISTHNPISQHITLYLNT